MELYTRTPRGLFLQNCLAKGNLLALTRIESRGGERESESDRGEREEEKREERKEREHTKIEECLLHSISLWVSRIRPVMNGYQARRKSGGCKGVVNCNN